MFSNILAVVIIVMLIFTNGITDAPNAIATIVGSKVMKFRKAAIISAIFNFIGIVVMSFVNISVADCISSMVDLNSGREGIVILITAMLSVILFALIAMQFGIPTSETHGLVAGLTGSAVAIYGISSVSGKEWLNVGIGLIWSIVGTFIISYILNIILKKLLKNVSDNVVSKFQTLGMCMMSFMHGAQDGQKFIGILIIYYYIVNGMSVPDYIVPSEHIVTILFVAVVMLIGVSMGGKKIVENIGSNVTNLTKKQALFSDVATSITLLIASMNGLPVSTTHAKTVAIIGVGKSEKQQVSKKAITQIIKAWFLTFPVCLLISFFLAKIFIKF
mgnify:FL=1